MFKENLKAMVEVGSSIFNSKPFQVVLHASIVTIQCWLIDVHPELVRTYSPGLAILAAGLGFTLQAQDKK